VSLGGDGDGDGGEVAQALRGCPSTAARRGRIVDGMSALAAVGRTVRRVWGRAWPPSKWVADSPASRRPPMSNYIPNSDGKGGKVISSGHPGGN